MRTVSKEEREALLAIARREANARAVRQTWERQAAQSREQAQAREQPGGTVSLASDVVGDIIKTPVGAFRVHVVARDGAGDLKTIDFLPMAEAA